MGDIAAHHVEFLTLGQNNAALEKVTFLNEKYKKIVRKQCKLDYIGKAYMLRAIPRFLVSLLLGLCLGIAALALAGYMNIWKQTWRASFAIVEEIFDLPKDQPNTKPKVPIELGPVLYNPSPERLRLGQQRRSNDRYIPKETSVQASIAAMSVLANISTDPAKLAQRLLQKLKATAVACPDSGTIYWDDCYGTFKAPWNVTYEGIWKGDKLTGFGTSVNLTSGEIYIGKFIDNMYHGCGALMSENGDIERGIWNQNVLVQSDAACQLPESN